MTERLYPLRFTGGGSTASKGIGVMLGRLHSEAVARSFKEDNDIPDDANGVPYALEVSGYDPTPSGGGGPGEPAVPVKSRSHRVREVFRHEYRKLSENPQHNLEEPQWKSS